MSTMGTFDAFTTARLGIYAAQHGLRVTGNNISNINTAGYTRQRLDQVSFKAGAYDMYRSQLDNHVGSGALVMGINQVRDPYLDVRYRNTNADVGYNDRMLAGLQEIASILDEVGLGESASDNEKGDGLLHAQIQDLSDKLRAYAAEPTKTNNDLVRTSAEILCGLFNKYADKLDRLYQDTVKDFDDQVTIVNECLKNIRDLNREIRDCEVYGDNALELRDERNRQIDTLSQYIHIKVVYSEESIGSGQTVEKLSIYLDNDNPEDRITTDESMLIDGIYGAQLYKPEERVVFNPKYGSTDPADADMADFLYMAKDGVSGTNFVEDALTEENDNFSLQISKLLDVNNKEWTRATSEGPTLLDDAALAALGGQNPKPAKYTFTLTSDPDGDWDAPNNQIVIGGETFTVGQGGLTLDIVQDAEKLAAFAARKLNENSQDYYVTADGADIVFTARKAGLIGSQGPAAAPTLDLTNDTRLTLTPGANQYDGQDSVAPTAPAPNPSTDPDTGLETHITYTLKNRQWYQTTTYIEHTFDIGLDDNDLHGSLQATRELLTEQGEFSTTDTIAKIDEDAEIKRGIPYYQLSLDLLARQFATQYNKINVGYMQDKDGYYIDKDGEQLKLPDIFTGENLPVNSTTALTAGQKQNLINNGYVLQDNNGNLIDENGKPIPAGGEPVPDIDRWLAEQGGEPMGGLLFSNRNDRDSEGDPNNPADPPITAANISIAHKWATSEVELVPTYKVLFLEENGVKVPHTTQNDNAGHMLNLIEKSLVYNPQDLVEGAVSTKLFEGNFNDMFSKMNTICGQDIREANIALNTYYSQKVEIDTSRDGVSGVDLNDEAMNMMQFQKAYSAACRLMTTIDEALDRLINGTAV